MPQERRLRSSQPARAIRVLTLLSLLSGAAGPGLAQVSFQDPLTNKPLTIALPEGAKATEAVIQFHKTGQNPYIGNADAIAAGKKLYTRWCASCHLPDATGRIGPNLIDEEVRYPRSNTDIGMFEVIHAGGAGAMQAFGNRISQDEILQLAAYIRSLKK